MKKIWSVLLAVLCVMMLLTLPSCAKPTPQPTTAALNTDGEEATDAQEEIVSGAVNPIVITEIQSDYFLAKDSTRLMNMKIYGSLSDDWCVGDYANCDFENARYDDQTETFEADMVNIRHAVVQEPNDNDVSYKPVIYLYPEKTTEVNVKLDVNGEVLCTYPAYNDGWTVTAEPDGTLSDGKLTYNYLFWDGYLQADYDFTQGFCVKGSDTAAFLEKSLEQLGLNRKEANEFIVFWLQKMQDHPYNVISFQTTAYTDAAQLEITPAPDTLIRVYMAWYPSDKPLDLPAQELSAPERNGFTVVEWGGVKTK